MRHTTAAAALTAALCAAALACSTQAAPPVLPTGPPVPPARFASRVTAVPQAKLGASHRAGCPVPPERLRLIRMNHWGFDGRVHAGEMVAHENAVTPLLHVFERAFAARFPIRRMRVMAEYRNDEQAMADDNTSGFNCRPVTGDPRRLSRHAWGDAVDINPAENPYVDVNGTVHPPRARPHLQRSPARAGQIHPDDAVSAAFREAGWQWGGRWANPDYQHFSANGG
ncbi:MULTISPECIES: M15 family metallopeptidase [unclassified Streptomyces]|uniref:M15 family metallopeptidase n=1 Tax=unclassified Streptomyces TaxID=2593676 RepID=UPI0004462891|nr:M15 family metallopeptidase [Streptomyces sp. PCS3-D2]WKV75843.1 M15 family metallopeptidase [Streptomyces sp. PCS3-D2]